MLSQVHVELLQSIDFKLEQVKMCGRVRFGAGHFGAGHFDAGLFGARTFFLDSLFCSFVVSVCSSLRSR